MKEMRIEQLRYILTVYEEKSISRAAKKLFMSQPSLSNAISSLEKELGASLFERGRDGVTATEFGMQIIQKARKVLGEVDDIMAISYNEVANQVATLQVLCVPLFCNWLIIETMFEMKKRFPKIDLVVVEQKNIDMINGLMDSSAFVGILGIGAKYRDTYEQHIKNADLHFTPLFANGICAYVNKNHALADKEYITLKDLEKETIITYDDFRYNTVLNGNSFANISHQGSSQSLYLLNDSENIKNLVASNHGIAVLPNSFAINNVFIQMGLVKVREIADLNESLIVGVISRKGREYSIPENGFLDCMKKIAKKYKQTNLYQFVPVPEAR